MTQQDEKLTSLWTISPACHTPNMPSMPHTKCHTLYSYWTCTHFSLSHPPLCFPDFCKPFPVLFRDRTLVQVWARAPPCAGHGVKASSYGNLPLIKYWAYTLDSSGTHWESWGATRPDFSSSKGNQPNQPQTYKEGENTHVWRSTKEEESVSASRDWYVLTPINWFKSKPWAFPEMWQIGALFSCLHRQIHTELKIVVM